MSREPSPGHEPPYQFLDYLVQRIYLFPAGEHHPWRRQLLARRLGVDVRRVADLAAREPGARARPRRRGPAAWLRLALQRAEAGGERRILVLRDDLRFHPQLDARLERALAHDTGLSVRLAPGAYLLDRRLFPRLRRALDAHRSEPDHALAAVLAAAEPLGLGGVVSPNGSTTPPGAPEANRRISVCCATRRPEYLDNVLANVGRQSYPDRELVLVLNGWPAPADLEARARRAGVEHLTVLETPAETTLGECLNAGVAASDATYWCKLDDDDFYARDYLLEAWEHLTTLEVDVVGKPRFHVFFPRHHQGCTTTDREYAGLPFRRHNGATICTHRRLLEELPFEPLDLGEDLELYRTLHRRGATLGDTSLGNYVYIRHGDNTSEFERHLSEPWDLDRSPLYRQLARDYAPLARPDLAHIELPDLKRYLDHVIRPRQRRRRVPRVIHQIWIGPHPPPVQWMDTWRHEFLRRHPDWRYRLWTDAEVASLAVTQTRAYRHLSFCGRADLLRYEILHRKGGVYIDADSAYLPATGSRPEPARPSLEDLVRNVGGHGLALAEEPFRRGERPLIAVGVIASVAGNPLLEVFRHRGLAAVEATLENGGHLQAWQTTGPRMVTEVLEAVGCPSILPAHVFFPEYWNRKTHWRLPIAELAHRYPRSVMFQFGYSTNELRDLEGGGMLGAET